MSRAAHPWLALALPWPLLAFALTGCNALIGLSDVPVPADAQGEPPGAEGGLGSDATVAPSSDGASAFDGSDGGAALAMEASPCGDTQGSGQNCGYCGHDCLGGACSLGACQPFAIVPADSGANPYGLAQDDTYLYWTDNDNSVVMRTSKVGGTSEVLSSSTYVPEPIAVDDGGIYWADISSVWSCPKAGCGVSPTELSVITGLGPVDLALDDTTVYWTVVGGRRIYGAVKGGTEEQTPTTLWEGDASPNYLAIDSQRIYFTADDGLLRGVAVDGSAPVAIGAADPAGSWGVALDTTNVYWSVPESSRGVIDFAPTASLDASSLATGLSSPSDLVSDGTSLYWLASLQGDAGTTGGVMSCVIASCAPALRASGFTYVVDLVVDSAAIYWTDNGTLGQGNGAIWKLAK